MQIPATVKIGHLVYRVVRVKDLRAQNDRNWQCFGQVDHVEKEIQLREGNTPEQDVSTFFHECLHVLSDQVFALGLNEKQVKRLGAGLAMLLLDNHLLRED